MTHFNYYKLGGSLRYQDPTYVVRQADTELYEGLLNGNLCYVFNSRQMGKSSLRVQITKQLKEQGVKCAAVDLTSIGNHVTPSEWYNGFISELLRGFSLSKKVDFGTWRRQHEFLSPNQQLIKLIDDVILKEFPGRIIIFLDEIDSILSIDFKDDFFALIRYFCNQIIDNQEYQRLTFCLLGVTTPSDLVSDQNRTPFNVGIAIELTGFKLSEVESLIRGLEGIVARPTIVMEEVLKWTEGQPFLTQKLCQLICISEEDCPAYHEIECVEKLVRTQIIENWEAQDEPEHLRTIRKNLLQKYQNQVGRLLGLYQQILTQGEIPADDSPEQTQLRLTGLIVRQQGKLRVYNGIYTEIFNQAWIEKELANIRPYAESFKAWIASNCQDELYLLRGKNLQDARIWAENKGLSDLDRKFIDASQELEKREIKERLQAEAESSRILAEANEALEAASQKSERLIKKSLKKSQQIVLIVLGISIITAIITGVFVNTIVQVEKIKSLTTSSDALLNSNKELDALVTALKAATQVKLTTWADTNAKEAVRLALQRADYKIREGVRERNRLEKHNDGVRSVNFSPDGRYIVTASEDSTVRLWGIDGKEIKKLPAQNQHFRSAIFSPDSKAIAAVIANNTIKVWGIDGREIITIKGQEEEQYMSGICFTQNGKLIAAPSQDNKVNVVKLWNIQGQAIKTFSGHKYNIWSISCSPDGKTIATADIGGFINIRSLDGGEIKTFSAGQNAIFDVRFSPDGKTIATAGGDTNIRLWNLDGKEIRTLGKHDNFVINVSFSPDGKTIASASADKTVKLWSIDGKELNTLRGHSYYVFSASFSPDGKMIASASADNTVKLWNINQQEPKTFIGHNDSLWGVSFSPDGKTIASAGHDKTIKLWSIDGQELKSITTDNSTEWSAIWSLNFSPDGKTIATANHDKTIKLWNLEGQNIKTFTGHTQEIRDVNFSPDGRTLVSASYDGTVKLWDINGQELRTLNTNAGKLFSANFSPDGQTIVSGHNDGTVRLWNLQGKNFKTVPAHNSYVTDVRFSPDGQIIASASQDKTIKLWNLDGKEIRTLKGQNAGITRFSFSPDSKILASASADGTIKLWQVKDGLELKTIEGRGYPIWNLNFSPDGKKIASVSDDGLVELWNTETLDFDQLIVRGCSWLHDYLKNNPGVPETDKHICK
ncbi:MAG TPA: AAA-like domain-containing protein [Trichormus sp. M33_DOE_039]|nr:AAA-like domain-containing protein [Trichormus sp. M33_DOE_039]